MTSANYPSLSDVMDAMAAVDQHHRATEDEHRQAVQDAQAESAGDVDSGRTESTALG